MSATDRYEMLHQLTSDQLTVISLLVEGATHQEAADRVGVHRVTVTRWRNHHPAFIARLNEIHGDIVAELKRAALQNTETALCVVNQALAEGNVDVAFRWLGTAAKFTVPRSGPDDSEAVVEARRKKMPTLLDNLLMTEGPTTGEAEAEILARLDAEFAEVDHE